MSKTNQKYLKIVTFSQRDTWLRFSKLLGSFFNTLQICEIDDTKTFCSVDDS